MLALLLILASTSIDAPVEEVRDGYWSVSVGDRTLNATSPVGIPFECKLSDEAELYIDGNKAEWKLLGKEHVIKITLRLTDAGPRVVKVEAMIPPKAK